MFIIDVENGFILRSVQGLIKIKVALEDESRREEGNKRDAGLLVSWKCRSVIVWMEMRAENDNYGSERPSLVCGRGEDGAHHNYRCSSEVWGISSSEISKFPDFSTSQGSLEWPFLGGLKAGDGVPAGNDLW